MGFNIFPDYQSLDKGTKGEPAKANRSIPDRIKEYGILDYITKDSVVLDLGCNRGYFGICLSPYISHYIGIDSDRNQIQFGINERISRQITNVYYSNTNYSLNLSGTSGTYDVILCFAFHIYTGVNMVDFAKHLVMMLKPKGHLFLEGHPKGYHLPNSTLNEPENYWNPLTRTLFQHLTIIKTKKVRDRGLLRPFIHYQK